MVPPPKIVKAAKVLKQANQDAAYLDRFLPESFKTMEKHKAHMKESSNAKGRVSKTQLQIHASNKIEHAKLKQHMRESAGSVMEAGTKAYKSLLMQAAQQCCNPHDNAHIENTVLLPVKGDTPTTMYCAADDIDVDYAPDGNTVGIPSGQTVGILFSDYVRNTITLQSCPQVKGTVVTNGSVAKSFYRCYGTDQDAGVVGEQPVVSFKRTLALNVPVPIKFDYCKPDKSLGLWAPHGEFMGVGNAKGTDAAFVWLNKGDHHETQFTNLSASATTYYRQLWRWTPEGQVLVGSLATAAVAAGASNVIQQVIPFDGYYAITATSSLEGQVRISLAFTNCDLSTNAVSADYCWAHVPAPGFIQAAGFIDAGRVNGTVLEYHNTGSVTNGQVYAGQFNGTSWQNIVSGGFRAFVAQTRNNEIPQNNPENLGGLVRIPLQYRGGTELSVSHRHTYNVGITYASFPIDETGPFCVLWTQIEKGNLGAPQSAVWKRGINMQFSTYDITRTVGISPLSRKEFNMVLTLVSHVPYWGSNELHWSEVTGFLNKAFTFAERALPYAKGILALL